MQIKNSDPALQWQDHMSGDGLPRDHLQLDQVLNMQQMQTGQNVRSVT